MCIAYNTVDEKLHVMIGTWLSYNYRIEENVLVQSQVIYVAFVCSMCSDPFMVELTAVMDYDKIIITTLLIAFH